MFVLLTFLLPPGEAFALFGPKPGKSFNPVRIARGVEEGPGRIAWSPDGRHVAYLDKALRVYEPGTGKKMKVDLGEPYFVAWGRRIYALYRAGDGNMLGIVDPGTYEVVSYPVGDGARAVHPVPGGDALVVFSSGAERTPIGTEVSYSMALLEAGSPRLREVFSASGTQFGSFALHSMSGWLDAGLNPVDLSAMFVEYRDPPALEPYARLKRVNHSLGRAVDVARVDGLLMTARSSHSPDGKRLALAGPDGRLRVLDLEDGEIADLEGAPVGAYPAWNPAGSQIFIGGGIIDSDGSGVMMVAPDGARSTAYWSPDGTGMALLLDGSLWLLEGFGPRFVPPDGPTDPDATAKAALLMELFKEGLITEEDFEVRRARLFEIDRPVPEGR